MIGKILQNELRFLTFRKPSNHLRENTSTYLAFGLVATWIAGVGRYWDNPRAELWQHLGLGSVIYLFVLAALVYGVVKPLGPKNWSYRNVLLFIALTAPPAVLYAIPVERFMPLEQAAATNAWFLAVVASWRVVLYAWFMRVFSGLAGLPTLVATLLPLMIIVFGLSMLNLEHVVFRLMGGILEEEKSANDAAYIIVLAISYLSMYALPVVLALYAWCIFRLPRVEQGG